MYFLKSSLSSVGRGGDCAEEHCEEASIFQWIRFASAYVRYVRFFTFLGIASDWSRSTLRASFLSHRYRDFHHHHNTPHSGRSGARETVIIKQLTAAMALRAACSGIPNKRLHTHTHTHTHTPADSLQKPLRTLMRRVLLWGWHQEHVLLAGVKKTHV